MSTLKVNKLRDTAGSADAITLDPNGGAVLAGVTTVSTVKVGSGVTISSDGDVFTTGIATSSTVIVGSGVTISESGIEASGIGITCANINGAQIGGRRNIFINGDMQVAQRATSITASGSYGIDRWWLAHNGTTTMARDTTVPSGEGFDYSFKLSNISGGDAAIGQPIELITAGKQGGLASGKKITFSFYAKCDSGTDGITVICNFRQAKYSSTNQVSFTGSGSGVTLTTTWTRFVVTMTIPTCHSGSTMAAFELNGISGTSHFTGFQMEIGSQATSFEHLGSGEELALCQRYFYRIGGKSNAYQLVGNGFIGLNGGTRCAKVVINFPTTMRATPTLEVIGTDSFSADTGGAAATFPCTATGTGGGLWSAASTGDIAWLDFGRTSGGEPAVGTAVVVYLSLIHI